MIIEGVEGELNLKSIYKRLNADYFNGALPSIKLAWSGKLKNAIGQARVQYKGTKIGRRTRLMAKYMDTIPESNIEVDRSSLSIKISKNFDFNKDDVDAVMLHEMTHILLYTQRKIGGHHDTPEFDGWIKKLRDQSGLNVPFKESEFKKSPKLEAKEGFVMIIFERSGDKGIIQYSKNFIQGNKWMLFTKMIGRVVGASSKVVRVEMYVAKHPIIATLTTLRSMKGLKWYPTDDETVQEIQRTGKRFLYADKLGGAIAPKIAGIRTSEPGELKFDKNGEWIQYRESIVDTIDFDD